MTFPAGMETKHIIALVALVALTCGSVLLTAYFQRMRDLAMFALIATAGLAERLDVNLAGEYWYRGTTRGFGIGLADVLAFSLVIASWVAPRHGRRPWFVPATFGAFSLYALYAALSLTAAAQPWFGLWEWINIPRGMLIMLATAMFVSTRRELAIVVAALAGGVVFQVGWAAKQRFLDGLLRPFGTLDHANSLSMFLCLVAPVLLATALADFSRWLRGLAGIGVALAALGVVLTLSRAGVPIFVLATIGAGVACVGWQITRHKVMTVGGVALFALVVGASSWDLLEARYVETTLTEELLEVQGENRGVYWRLAGMMAREQPLGVGLNNWSYQVSGRYGAHLGLDYENYDRLQQEPDRADLPSTRYAPPAHSLVALTLGELGLGGLIVFGYLWLRWFRLGASFLRYRLRSEACHRVGVGIFFGTVGLFLQGLTEWTYRQPAIFITFHALLGAGAGLQHAWALRQVQDKLRQRVQSAASVAEKTQSAIVAT